MSDQTVLERKLGLSPDHDFERWNEGSNPNGDPRNDTRPYYAHPNYPYQDRSDPDAKGFALTPDFSDLAPRATEAAEEDAGAEEESEEAPEATTKAAPEKPRKAAGSGGEDTATAKELLDESILDSHEELTGRKGARAKAQENARRDEEAKKQAARQKADRAELESLRASVVENPPPELKQLIEDQQKKIAELEAHDIRPITRASQEFVERYDKPRTQIFNAVLDKLGEIQYDDPQHKKQTDDFIADLRKKGPDAFTRQQWIDRVWIPLHQGFTEDDRKLVEGGILFILNAGEKRDQEAAQLASNPRTYAEMADRQDQERKQQYVSRYHHGVQAAAPRFIKSLAPYIPYLEDEDSPEYQAKREQFEKRGAAINDWSDPDKKAAADVEVIGMAIVAQELLEVVRQKDAELKRLRPDTPPRREPHLDLSDKSDREAVRKGLLGLGRGKH
jgi:hypothetical protein